MLCFLEFESIPVPFSFALNRLGAKSYGIYLIHYESLGLVSKSIYHFLPSIPAWQVLYQPILLYFGLGVTFWFIEAITRSPIIRFDFILLLVRDLCQGLFFIMDPENWTRRRAEIRCKMQPCASIIQPPRKPRSR